MYVMGIMKLAQMFIDIQRQLQFQKIGLYLEIKMKIAWDLSLIISIENKYLETGW